MRVEGRNIDGDGNDGGDAADGAYQESESFDTHLLTCISSEDREYSTSHPRTDIELDVVDIPSVKKRKEKKSFIKRYHEAISFSHILGVVCVISLIYLSYCNSAKDCNIH